MPKPLNFLFVTVIASCLIAGCGKGSSADTSTPLAFLKWSMDQYHRAPAFNSDTTVKLEAPFLRIKRSTTRQVAYSSPNLYRVVTGIDKGPNLTTDSDGKVEVTYSNNPHMEAMSGNAPKTLAESKAAPLSDPTVSGSLLYQFFGGSSNLSGLVGTATDPITWGPDGTTSSGEKTKSVRFVGSGNFGHVEATIGVDTGLVYQIKSDLAPITQQTLHGQTPDEVLDRLKTNLASIPKGPQYDFFADLLKKGPSAFSFSVVESYTNPKFAAVNTPHVFDASLPKGVKLAPPPPDGKPPVALGSPAPDFTVKDLHGAPVRLSSLKGHVVMVDFWATWCGPCKKGLPDTANFAKVGASKGLKVLAVSAEDAKKIASFVAAQSYTLPAYTDPDSATNVAYHVDGIPTIIVIDAKGNLVDYLVGLQDPATVAASLKKAGLDLGS